MSETRRRAGAKTGGDSVTKIYVLRRLVNTIKHVPPPNTAEIFRINGNVFISTQEYRNHKRVRCSTYQILHTILSVPVSFVPSEILFLASTLYSVIYELYSIHYKINN